MDQAMNRMACAAVADLGILQSTADYARRTPVPEDFAGSDAGLLSVTCDVTLEDLSDYPNAARTVQAIACIVQNPGEERSDWTFCSTSMCEDDWPSEVPSGSACAYAALGRSDPTGIGTVELDSGQVVCVCTESDTTDTA